MRQFLRRVWYVFRRRRFDADLSEELAFHDALTRRELAAHGADSVTAARGARRAGGSLALARNQAWDVWMWPGLQDISQDARMAARRLRKDAPFTVVATATLALSLGFNTTLFSIVNGMNDGSPVVDRPHQMVTLGSRNPAGHALGTSYGDFLDYRGATSFEGLSAYATAAMTLTDRDQPAGRVAGAYIAASTFPLLGERPLLGRDFRVDDDRPGAEPVAILGARVWTSRYDADPGIIGRPIAINGRATMVIGVMREGFRSPLVHDLWQPLASLPGLREQGRDVRRLSVVGRLARGVRIEQARAELDAIGSALANTYPATNASVRPSIRAFTGGFDLRNPWNASLIGVSLVLLIACANLANLLLARAAHRSAEIAIRMSLGASRWRIMRQLLMESLLLATLAGVAGLGIALFGVQLWVASMPQVDWPYWYHFSVNGPVLAYLAAISLGSVLLFGVVPALHLSKGYPAEQTSDVGRGRTIGPRPRWWTNLLLGGELALTLALLAGAGLLARTFLAVYRADAIVDTSRVVLAGVDLVPDKYPTPAQRVALYSQLESRVGAVPSVDAVTIASGAPFYSAPIRAVTLEGQAPGETPASLVTSYVLIGSRYFDTLDLRLNRGRVFTDLDGTPGHETAIVNQLFASKYLPGLDPIGQRIRLADPNTPDPHAPWLSIIGVAPTVREHYAQEFDPVVYVPYRLTPLPEMMLLTRAHTDAASLAPALREALRQLDPDLPLLDVRPLDWLVSGTRFANRVFATLFAIAAGLALLIAAVGLHAITSYTIRRRLQEIGIRMALGAAPGQVTWLFVRRVLTPLAWGLALGLVGAFGVGQIVKGMLIQTSPHDSLTLTSICVVLITVALVATARPARQAARIDPAVSLRYE